MWAILRGRRGSESQDNRPAGGVAADGEFPGAESNTATVWGYAWSRQSSLTGNFTITDRPPGGYKTASSALQSARFHRLTRVAIFTQW